MTEYSRNETPEFLLIPVVLAAVAAWATTAWFGATFAPPVEAEPDAAAVSLSRFAANPFCVAIIAAGLWALIYAALEALGLAQDDRSVRTLHWLTGRRVGGFVPPQTTLSTSRDLADHAADSWETRLGQRLALLWFAAWLLPLMGFVGTVVGISSAIGDLTGVFEQSADRDESIKDVLGGLRFAFDTTFLGLVLVIPVMGGATLLRMRADRVRGALVTRLLNAEYRGAK